MEIEAQDIEASAGEEKRLSAPRRFKFLTKGRSADLGATIHLGVFALLLAVTMPRLLRPLAPAWDTLDTSWAWMLGYALQHHLQWGESIVFTYGPLGFLTHTFFYSDHTLWTLTATVRLLSWFVFGLGFACILRRLIADEKPFPRTTIPVAIGWTVGASFLHLSTQSAVLGVLLLALAIAEEGSRAALVELALAGALLALGALIKSSALIVSLFALLMYPALWRYAGRRKSALHLSLLPLLTFFISLFALWLLSSQSFAHLPDYFRGTWAIVSGYTAAMSVTGLGLQILLALLILALFAAVPIGLYGRGKRPLMAQSLLLGGVAFWAWKEGFTLQDWDYSNHPMIFYGIALLIASVGTVLLPKENSRFLTTCIYSAYAVALWCCIQGYPTLSLSYKQVLGNYKDYLTLVISESRQAAEQRGQTMAIQRQFHLSDGLLKAVGHASVNVLPWSLMMVQGYGFRLVASPIIQTYAVYTPYLDLVNARQIWDGRSADKIIYTPASLGDRYGPFDEPATFRALLTCYRTQYSGRLYAVLSRVTCAPSEMLGADKPEEVAFGKWFAVPRQVGYAKVGVHITVIGRVMNLLYKAGPVQILFRLANGAVAGPYRLIYPVAGDGLFIRYFIGSPSDAALLFSGNASDLQRIAAIKILTKPGSLDYAKHFEVRFFR